MESERKGPVKAKLLAALVHGLKPEAFQKRPYFPDISRQPDLLIVPEIGNLVAVFIYQVRPEISWRVALAALEAEGGIVLREKLILKGEEKISGGFIATLNLRRQHVMRA